jgi:hypothetical protein
VRAFLKDDPDVLRAPAGVFAAQIQGLAADVRLAATTAVVRL